MWRSVVLCISFKCSLFVKSALSPLLLNASTIDCLLCSCCSAVLREKSRGRARRETPQSCVTSECNKLSICGCLEKAWQAAARVDK